MDCLPRTWQATRPRPSPCRPRQSLVSGFMIMRLPMRLSSKNTGSEDVAAGGVGAVEPPVVEGLAVGQVRAEPWCSAQAMDAAGGAMTLGSGLAARRRSLSPSLPLLPNRTKAAPQGESPATFSDQTVPSPTSITLYSWLCRSSYELEPSYNNGGRRPLLPIPLPFPPSDQAKRVWDCMEIQHLPSPAPLAASSTIDLSFKSSAMADNVWSSSNESMCQAPDLFLNSNITSCPAQTLISL